MSKSGEEYPEHLNPFESKKKRGGIRGSFRKIGKIFEKPFKKHDEDKKPVDITIRNKRQDLSRRNYNNQTRHSENVTIRAQTELFPRSRFSERVKTYAPSSTHKNPFDDEDDTASKNQFPDYVDATPRKNETDTEGYVSEGTTSLRKRRKKKKAPLPPGALRDHLDVPDYHTSMTSITSYETDCSSYSNYSGHYIEEPVNTEELEDIMKITNEIKKYCDEDVLKGDENDIVSIPTMPDIIVSTDRKSNSENENFEDKEEVTGDLDNRKNLDELTEIRDKQLDNKEDVEDIQVEVKIEINNENKTENTNKSELVTTKEDHKIIDESVTSEIQIEGKEVIEEVKVANEDEVKPEDNTTKKEFKLCNVSEPESKLEEEEVTNKEIEVFNVPIPETATSQEKIIKKESDICNLAESSNLEEENMKEEDAICNISVGKSDEKSYLPDSAKLVQAVIKTNISETKSEEIYIKTSLESTESNLKCDTYNELEEKTIILEDEVEKLEIRKTDVLEETEGCEVRISKINPNFLAKFEKPSPEKTNEDEENANRTEHVSRINRERISMFEYRSNEEFPKKLSLTDDQNNNIHYIDEDDGLKLNYVESKSLHIDDSPIKISETSIHITGSCDDLDETDDQPVPKVRKNKLTKNALLGTPDNN